MASRVVPIPGPMADPGTPAAMADQAAVADPGTPAAMTDPATMADPGIPAAMADQAAMVDPGIPAAFRAPAPRVLTIVLTIVLPQASLTREGLSQNTFKILDLHL